MLNFDPVIPILPHSCNWLPCPYLPWFHIQHMHVLYWYSLLDDMMNIHVCWWFMMLTSVVQGEVDFNNWAKLCKNLLDVFSCNVACQIGDQNCVFGSKCWRQRSTRRTRTRTWWIRRWTRTTVRRWTTTTTWWWRRSWIARSRAIGPEIGVNISGKPWWGETSTYIVYMCRVWGEREREQDGSRAK